MSNIYPSTSNSSGNSSSILFHNDINKIYDEEWQKLLVRANEKSEKFLPYLLKLQSSFDTISKLCQQEYVPVEAEFIAFDCLESMLESFFYDLTAAINKEAKGDGDAINSFWSDSFKVFEEDVPLIIFLIISIAAKFTDANTPFDLHKVQELVEKVTGESYTLQDIKSHESNLFKTMNFKVSSPIALQSMEQLMKLIFDKRFIRVSLKEFLKVGVLVLRFSYLEKNKIYESLAKGVTDRVQFKQFTGDKILLAEAVVYASCHFVNAPKPWITEVPKQLSDTCHHAERDIIVVGRAIMTAFTD